MSARGRFGLDPNRLRITRGAMYLAFAEVGLSLVYLASPEDVRQTLLTYLAAAPSNLQHGRVWTLVSGALLEPRILSLVMHVFVLWQLAPTLERFWGTPRFLRFAAITSLVGTVAGTLFGWLVTGHDTPILGLSPFINASIVAFGIVYARQPVQFFGTLPLTGRQMMYGIMALVGVSVLLQQDWENGVAFVAAGGAAALMTSKWSPVLAWRRRKVARARAKLSVLQGGQAGLGRPAGKPKRNDDHRFLN